MRCRRLVSGLSEHDGPVLYLTSNGFACYLCYRVRPFNNFVVRQVREKHTKTDHKEGVPGFQRFCIDCAIEHGLWRTRTRIGVVEEMFVAMRRAGVKPRVTAKYMFYCGICKALKPATDNPNCECFDCGARSKFDKLHGVFYQDNTCFFTCLQCQRKCIRESWHWCKFCNGPVCKTCGYPLDEEGEWWCGRECSSAAYEFCCTMTKIGVGLKLWKSIQERRMLRATTGDIDMFETKFNEEDSPRLLSL